MKIVKTALERMGFKVAKVYPMPKSSYANTDLYAVSLTNLG